MTAAASPLHRGQRGMATLIVVMVLFFLVSMVAAYTNRNLIFEQRTSANNLRATVGQETAQAGLEWALSMLNSGRINAVCVASTNVANTSFRERYIGIDTGSGQLSALDKSTGGVRSAACAYTGTQWICDCPADADPLPTMPPATTARQSYRVWFSPLTPGVPNTLRMDVLACPSWDANCLDINNVTGAEGRTRVSTLVTLYASPRATPSSALTARGQVDGTAATVAAYNDNVEVGGIAVAAGGAISGVTGGTIAGSPAGQALQASDPSLSNLAGAPPVIDNGANHLFAKTFGVLEGDYLQQPGLLRLGGCPCNADGLRNLIALNPGRPVWVDGNLTLDGTIGSATAPAAVVVKGNVTTSAATTFYGVLYVRSPIVAPATTGTWSLGGSVDVQGAAIAESDFVSSSAGTVRFIYDRNVLQVLQRTSGTWVALPGSWKDYQ